MTHRTLLLGLLSLFFGACSTKTLPRGTPPPEYEKRTFEPWPAASADAGTVAEAAPATAPEPALPDASDGPADASPDR